MATLTTTQTSPSLLGGVVIIGGTIIGAGMFSLPVVMSGAWFFWSMAALIFTWFCMLHSGLMILEANLNYRIGSSFDTITKDLLGKGWNVVNGIFRRIVPKQCQTLFDGLEEQGKGKTAEDVFTLLNSRGSGSRSDRPACR